MASTVRRPGHNRADLLPRLSLQSQSGREGHVHPQPARAGSSGQWQRHYFPIVDYRDQFRLVIATPCSPTARGRPPTINIAEHRDHGDRSDWRRQHQGSGWLVIRRRRHVEPPGVHGFLQEQSRRLPSLSGGRIGGAPGRSSNFGNLAPAVPTTQVDATALRRAAAAARNASNAAGRGAAVARGATGPPATSCDYRTSMRPASTRSPRFPPRRPDRALRLRHEAQTERDRGHQGELRLRWQPSESWRQGLGRCRAAGCPVTNYKEQRRQGRR
jgi:hypothetical protein